MVTPENQRVNRYIRGLAPEIKAHVTSSKPTTIQSAVGMANCLTTDGIKDGIFKKRENAGNKKSLNDQNKNRGRDDRNKRQRTGRNFALTAPKQGQGQRRYAGQHPKCAKYNFHHSGNCPVCGRCNQVGHFTRYCTSRATNERPRPNCFECEDLNALLNLIYPNELCGYVLWKPSRYFTRPLGLPSGLKGLLHMLNATVIPTKVS
ncbi:hypothetical protein Tco_1104735 [Tanacetum coccineum]